jgi:murein DD-endopeptidase MepM/ murein hydrolase activator NlpD
MKVAEQIPRLWLTAMILALTACSSPPPDQPSQLSELSGVAETLTPTPIATEELPEPTKDLPTSTPSPPAPDRTPTPTPCAQDVCYYPGHWLLQRPIPDHFTDSVDRSYRYGNTESGGFEPHHGVDFYNAAGTPVLAAAAGKVIVAGNDFHDIFGLYRDFYGNLVILQHSVLGYAQPVYTLYGHLSKIMVKVGELVTSGQKIGEVGATGVAIGSHLHFEVRQGKNLYNSTRNPELWLVPHRSTSGDLNGALAGSVVDLSDKPTHRDDLVVESRSSQDGPANSSLALETYADGNTLGDDNWKENFALGDLPGGWYRIALIENGVLLEKIVQVFPGLVTVVKLAEK